MRFTFFISLFAASSAAAQFAPQAGIVGSTAVSQNSPAIRGWATGCTVSRGSLDIARPDSGTASSGMPTDANGASDASVVSLGDSGVAVLTFAQPIIDGPGADFAVFENGFLNPQNAEEAFLELAFVEVSSNGTNYVRFPSRSLTQTSVQLSSVAGLGYINARNLHNLAGKYRAGFGTPFDLAELANTPGLNVGAITHVRIVDVVGHIGEHGSVDDSGAVINDPYPTFFPTGGFDLDAVAVLNQALSMRAPTEDFRASVYPNPTTGSVWIETGLREVQHLTVLDAVGRVVLRQTAQTPSVRIDLPPCANGLYRILLHSENHPLWSANVFVH